LKVETSLPCSKAAYSSAVIVGGGHPGLEADRAAVDGCDPHPRDLPLAGRQSAALVDHVAEPSGGRAHLRAEQIKADDLILVAGRQVDPWHSQSLPPP
jgi:hypothetical protein